ncbi:hypothetical protein B0H11DRAFT_1920621 [Mycena galericulata]|nr:hypothetical protein B0H11DRAFT_1920621 [Mycena galericulata]
MSTSIVSADLWGISDGTSRFLITGTSINGIGFEAARVIAKHASLVIITRYNAERLKLSEEAIKKEFPDANIRRLTLDLGSLAGVRKAAAEVNAYEEPLHVLIHNAAAAIGSFKLTPDGLESQIATDHIGPFRLTKLLTPKLLASTSETYTPRVVFVSSEAHAASSGVDGYNRDTGCREIRKRAGVLPSQVRQHPHRVGAVEALWWEDQCVQSSSRQNMLQKEESVADMQAIGAVFSGWLPNAEKFPFKTIPQGAATMVAASFDPESAVTAERLWTTTEKIIGETFTF